MATVTVKIQDNNEHPYVKFIFTNTDFRCEYTWHEPYLNTKSHWERYQRTLREETLERYIVFDEEQIFLQLSRKVFGNLMADCIDTILADPRCWSKQVSDEPRPTKVNPFTHEYGLGEVSELLGYFILKQSDININIKTISRTHALQTVNKYIQKNGLRQDDDRRYILVDHMLKTLLATNENRITYVQIISKINHMFPPKVDQ